MSHPQRCGCGRPVRSYGYLCEDCFATLAAWDWELPEVPRVSVSAIDYSCQHELAKKLNALTDSEWARFPLVGLPLRMQPGANP
jgi:hypothetical protein